MPESDEFWDFYWEMRLQPMENLGKREAILTASRLLRRLSQQKDHPLRILEPGCGEGQVVGTLFDAHAQLCDTQRVVGIDYNARSLARARRDYPKLRFQEGDFGSRELLELLGKYDLLLLVNALHEIFSAGVSPELGEVDVIPAKLRVESVFAGLLECLEPGGWVVLFDGLEPGGEPAEPVQIRFLDEDALAGFQTFASQYRPFRIQYRETETPLVVELSRHDFTRYITKSIFLGKDLWQSECYESYQYFTEDEFRAVCARLGLNIVELRTLTMNLEKWCRLVRIVTPGVDFPQEHILIVAQLNPSNQQVA
jgi:SAM-dependent methyltransferase